MNLLYIKSLHIIFVITWFCGLFYIVRLFIYDVEADDKNEPDRSILQNQLRIMQKRLWLGITWPSCVLSLVFGLILLMDFFPLSSHSWLITKLFFILLLFGYHLYCGHIRKKLLIGHSPMNSFHLRLFNEVATLLLFSIVFLVTLKNLFSAVQGVLALSLLSIVLFLAIKLYASWRNKK
jgi:putative membrane protein